MTTYEIIQISKALDKINNQEGHYEAEVFFGAGQFVMYAVSNKDLGTWELYIRQYNHNERKWYKDFIHIFNSFSTDGVIATAIDKVIEHIS